MATRASGGAEHVQTLIVGGGQAGLSVGYHLARRGLPFLILDAWPRVGDSWRHRWDSLRLFTQARFDGLDGMPFPAPPNSFPTKDEMGDYLESYARHFELPVRANTRVDDLRRDGEGFSVTAGSERFTADNVVVAMATFQKPWIPALARDLSPDIVQIHSKEYRGPEQLEEGPVLVVGAGNSGAEIAMELAPSHSVWLSGRDVGQIPFKVSSALSLRVATPIVFRVVFHRLLTVRTPMGRKVRKVALVKGGPLIRVKRKDLQRAGVARVPRVESAERGFPKLADGRVLEPANILWCTGFRPGFDWIRLPIHGEHEPTHRSGVVETEPGLYFVGLHFLHAFSSTMIHGVGRDAERIAGTIAERVRGPRTGSATAA
jgi:putative flavoprotein involved in K+ transport